MTVDDWMLAVTCGLALVVGLVSLWCRWAGQEGDRG